MTTNTNKVLKNSEEPIDDLNFVLNNLLLPIVIVDGAGVIRRFNDSWLKMFSAKGEGEQNYIYQNYFDVLKSLEQRKIYSSEVKNKIEEILKTVIKGNLTSPFLEFPIGENWFLSNMHPIHNNNKLHGFMIALHDVTSWKQKEFALQDEKNKTFESSQRKMFFLANLNHELKSPLNSIMGFAQLLKEQISTNPLLAGFTGLVENINEAASHLNSIVFRILDMAKVQSGTLVLKEEDIHPNKLIELSLNIVQPLFYGRQIYVECKCSLNQKLKCDKNLAMEVLINLLVNALKFSNQAVSIKCNINSANELEFNIIDKGEGMTFEEISIALEPFGQNIRSPSDKNTGLGLGVPFCNQVMNLHGGRLQLESKKGDGTIVGAVFPSYRIIT